MNVSIQSETSSPAAQKVAMGIMILASIAALYAFVTAIGVAMGAGPATQQVEWWRAIGFLMFASVFLLLGLWPQRYPGLWELTLANKALLTVIEFSLISQQVENAQSSAVVDAILTVLILVAYLLSKGYESWKK